MLSKILRSQNLVLFSILRTEDVKGRASSSCTRHLEALTRTVLDPHSLPLHLPSDTYTNVGSSTASSGSMDANQEGRHPSLYFPDGDIVLAAQARPAECYQFFRVHRVYLAHNSQVFRDMFTVASPELSARETYDGVAVVRMAGDDAADLASLLDVMYNPIRLHQKLMQTAVGDLPVQLAGLVRIAKKYDVKDIGDVVIDHIKKCWPESLEEWDEMKRLEKLDSLEPVSAYLFALEHGLTTILPATFYKLATTSTALHWDGSAHGARWDMLAEHVNMLKFVKARDDMFNCARDKVESVEERMTNEWKCKRSSICGGELGHVVEGFLSRIFCDVARLGPSGDYLEVIRSETEVFAMPEDDPKCWECCSKVNDTIGARRQDIWDAIDIVLENL